MAQPGSSDVAGKQRVRFEPELRFSRIGLDEGLPQSHVLSIAKDNSGFVWFGTQEGLARFDGHEITVFDVDDGLPANYISTIAPTENGLWIGTENGIALYDSTTNRIEVREVDKLEAPPTAMITHGEETWFATGDGLVGLLQRGDTAIQTSRVLNVAKQPVIATALAVYNGSLIIGTEKSGLIKTDGKGSSEEIIVEGMELSGQPVLSLAVIKDTLWVGTDGAGLLKLAKGQAPALYMHDEDDPSSLADDRVSALTVGSESLLWVGTNNGLSRLWVETERFDSFHADMSDSTALPFPYVTALLLDDTGILWAGTFAGGLCYIDQLRMKFSFYLSQATSATSFLESANGDLWIGTYPATLARANREKKYSDIYTSIELESGESIDISPYWLNQIKPTGDGKLWLSMYGLGVMLFDPAKETARLFTGADAAGLDRVWAIEEVKDKDWLFASETGLQRFSFFDESWTEIDSVPNSLYAIRVTSGGDTVWLGTADQGLLQLNLVDQSVKTYDEEAGLSYPGVLSIDVAEDGILWLGTYGGGLNKLDPKTGVITPVKPSKTTGSATMYGVLMDSLGRAWMSTNGAGLSRYDPKTEEMVFFGPNDGALAEYAQASYHAGDSGEFFFGGPGGFVHFAPEEVLIDDFAPAPIITEFMVFNKPQKLGKPIWRTKTIELAYGDSVVSFDFTALAYASPRARRFRHRLKGLHSDWIETDKTSVTYTSLDPGDYQLLLMAANRHGVWGPEVSVNIVVAPPWYLTWYAYLAYALMALGALFVFVRYQTARVEQERQASRLGAVERDLELTGAIQSGCLPAEGSIHTGKSSIEAFYRAAGQCSGDWWWHERLSPTRQLIIVGDVTGHGPGPAMVTASVAAAQRSQSRIGSHLGTGERIALLNEEVIRSGLGKYHMTLTALEIDETTGEYWVYAAGGLPPLTVDAQGKSRLVPCRGTPLGTQQSTFHVGTATGQLLAGQRVILYTDGIPEIELGNGRQLGMRRFTAMFGETVQLSLAQSIQHVTTSADKLRQERAQDDDWTIVALALDEPGSTMGNQTPLG